MFSTVNDKVDGPIARLFCWLADFGRPKVNEMDKVVEDLAAIRQYRKYRQVKKLDGKTVIRRAKR